MSAKRGGECATAIVKDENRPLWSGKVFVVQVVQHIFVGGIPGAQRFLDSEGIARELKLTLRDDQSLHESISHGSI